MDITVITETASWSSLMESDEDEEHFECIRTIGRALGYDIYAHAVRKRRAYVKGPEKYQVWARDAQDTSRYLGMLSAIADLRSSQISALIQAKFAAEQVPSSLLTKEDIVRIVKSVRSDCYVRFRRFTRKNGEASAYIHVIIDRIDCTQHSLGDLDDVAKMTEADLRQALATKFAQRQGNSV